MAFKSIYESGDAARTPPRVTPKPRRPAARHGPSGDLVGDYHRLVHELEVHQIELEMQNAELREAQEQSARLLERFTDLFEFAPVGYVSLNEAGLMQEVNLTATALLGVERGRLVQQSLAQFVAPATRPAFSAFLDQLLGRPGTTFGEVQFLRPDQAAIWVSLHGTSSVPFRGPHAWYRIALTDITASRQAADAEHNMEEMATQVLALQLELDASRTSGETMQRTGAKYARLLTQSQHMQKQMRRLSHVVMTERENDRRTISHDLHAVVSQTLIGINLRLEHLKRQTATVPGGLAQDVGSAQALLGSSMAIVRQYSNEIGPTVLDDLGLIPALELLVGRITKRTGLEIGLELCAEVEKLRLDRRLALYRVAEEALTNATGRPGASRVTLDIRKGPASRRMTVQDDGRLSGPSRRPSAASIGIIGMKERLAMVGGVLTVKSVPATGTTVVVQIPWGRSSKKTSR